MYETVTTRPNSSRAPSAGTVLRIAMSLLLAFGLTFALPLAANADANFRMKAKVNVRASPSTKAVKIGKVGKNERIYVICQDKGARVRGSGLWDYIEYRVGRSTVKKRGWVADAYVKTGSKGRVAGVAYGNCTGTHPKRITTEFDCSSRIIKHIKIDGYGRRFVISMTPSELARMGGPLEKYWRDALACIGSRMPKKVSAWQMRSLWSQFWCHGTFDLPFKHPAGPTWDLESWRADVSSDVIKQSAKSHCNWIDDGRHIQLDASNYPSMRVAASRGGQAHLVPISKAGQSGQYRLVLGLAGSGYSIQWVPSRTEPNSDYYLRHRNGRLMLEKVDSDHHLSSPLFAADATFQQEKRPGSSNQYNYRSYNFRDHHIRHYKGGLEIGTPTTHPGTPFAADHWFIRR
jgi:uncharacterized protein YraI